MGRPRKNKNVEVNEFGEIIGSIDAENVGIMGLFQPQECDIIDEMQTNEALRQYRLEKLEEE